MPLPASVRALSSCASDRNAVRRSTVAAAGNARRRASSCVSPCAPAPVAPSSAIGASAVASLPLKEVAKVHVELVDPGVGFVPMYLVVGFERDVEQRLPRQPERDDRPVVRGARRESVGDFVLRVQMLIADIW